MKTKLKKITNISSFILVTLFVICVFYWEGYTEKLAQQRLQTQAKVISNSLWNLDPNNSLKYLEIAAKISNYRQVEVYIVQSDKPFMIVEGIELGAFDKIFSSIGLIKSVENTVPIYHGAQVIGRLDVIHFHDNIYTYLHWLLVFLLVWMGIKLYFRTLSDKHTLEERVYERTREFKLSEKRYSSLVSNVPGVTYRCAADENWSMEFISNEIKNISGYKSSDFINNKIRTFDSIVHPDDSERVKNNLLSNLEEMKSFNIEYRVVDSVGNIHWVFDKGQVLFDEEEGRYFIDGVIIDITVRKEAEFAVLSKEEDLRTTLNSIGDGVIATDEQGIITRMNPVAENLTGWLMSEAQGMQLLDVFNIISFSTQEVCENPVDKVIESGEIVGLANHTLLISKTGQKYHIADSGAPIHSQSGRIVGVVLVFRDITEQHKLEEKLQQSEKMQAIGQLAGGVAHDFNNMLAGILGSTELLKSRIPQTADNIKFINLIIESAEHAANLTQKLLTFSRQQPSQDHIVDVHQVLNDTIDILKSTIDRRIRIVKKLDAQSYNIISDQSQLQNVFLNICINASHAIDTEGEIIISSKVVDIDEEYCQTSGFKLVAGEYLQIEIHDDGCGIKPDDMQKIFEPFFTTKPQGKGTGLGLSAVYGTIQQHLGAINVYSELGVGSTFNILLPLTKGESVAVNGEDDLVCGTGHILVVDDEEVLRFTAEVMLEKMGYSVTLCDNGKNCLKLFSENPSAYDLILLDMVMPIMNGKDCFKEIKKISPEMKVVVASGFTHNEDIMEMKQDGLKGFIKKPYRLIALSRVINDALTS